jgi:hypothetical protein
MLAHRAPAAPAPSHPGRSATYCRSNTARGRRIADLVRAYLAALGDPADIERQSAVIAAAELAVLAEEARTAALKQGAAADLDQVVRVQGAADRALRRLGIRPGAEPKVPSLAEWAEGVRNAPPSPCGGLRRAESGEGPPPFMSRSTASATDVRRP